MSGAAKKTGKVLGEAINVATYVPRETFEAGRQYFKGQHEAERNKKIAAEESKALSDKQNTLLAQQEAEIKQRRQKLTQTQMQFLKSRFRIAGGALASQATQGFGTNAPIQTPQDLFSKITGRN